MCRGCIYRGCLGSVEHSIIPYCQSVILLLLLTLATDLPSQRRNWNASNTWFVRSSFVLCQEAKKSCRLAALKMRFSSLLPSATSKPTRLRCGRGQMLPSFVSPHIMYLLNSLRYPKRRRTILYTPTQITDQTPTTSTAKFQQ